MRLALLIRPEAEDDLRGARSWYEDKRTGLGDDFILCLEAALGRIQDNPLQYPFLYKEIRRAPVPRFPYAVFFIVSNQAITVMAVIHYRRNPRIWHKRLGE